MTPRCGLAYSVNCSMLFTELPANDRPAAVAAAGFDAIEFWWPFDSATPGDDAVEAFVEAVESANVRLALMNFYAGDLPGGDRGILSHPARRSELRDSLDIAVHIGERLDCRLFNALYGRRVPALAAEAQDEYAAEQLAVAAEAVGGIDGVVVLEALSGMDDYPLRTLGDCVSVIDRLHGDDVQGVAVLADLYHLAVNGDQVGDAILENADRIGHVQVADAPGRTEPGRGTLPLRRWLGDLVDAGYQGRVGLEYLPSMPGPESACESALHLSGGRPRDAQGSDGETR